MKITHMPPMPSQSTPAASRMNVKIAENPTKARPETGTVSAEIVDDEIQPE